MDASSTTPVPAEDVNHLRISVEQLARDVRGLEQLLEDIREELVRSVRNDQPSNRTADPASLPQSPKSFEEQAADRSNRTPPSPPQPKTSSPVPAAPPKAFPSSSVVKTHASGKNSLKDRMYDQPLYGEIVRIVGYDGMALPSFNLKGNELVGTYDHATVITAASSLTRIDATNEPATVHLTDEVRRWAWPLLGPDPRNPPWWSANPEVSSSAKEESREPVTGQQQSAVSKPNLSSQPRRKTNRTRSSQ